MKPFNLEEAKAGKPIVNTFGSKIKFIAFEPELEQPLICAVNRCLLQFNANGQCIIDQPSEHDLFMAPTKREGWVNVYIGNGIIAHTAVIHTNKDSAAKSADKNRIACVRIEWEE